MAGDLLRNFIKVYHSPHPINLKWSIRQHFTEDERKELYKEIRANPKVLSAFGISVSVRSRNVELEDLSGKGEGLSFWETGGVGWCL